MAYKIRNEIILTAEKNKKRRKALGGIDKIKN